ncbi:MAG TPA: hypothetical protein VIN08_22895 [Ohtaekwangia sp.]|uniref:hypothetical protein n=1 Tax=Ohtaekwangia sp. TaxID=2066019 RepID=UPI002F95E5BA
MKLSAKAHGILDYVVVIFLLASPTIFGLPATTAIFTYILGLIHLLLTVATDFPVGIVRIIPFKIHGYIELIVSFTLIAIAFWLAKYDGAIARNYYLAFGSVVFLTWLITDYKEN